MTRRGKATLTAVVVGLIVVFGLAALLIAGKAPGALQDVVARTGLVPSPSPEPVCPLTGAPPPGGSIPDRAALAIKVENLPEARPQYGLAEADIVVEEPVEGGITRFIVIYHCEDAKRVEPVRSARTTDPLVLSQLGTSAFGYADAAGYVQRAVEKYGRQIDDVNWQRVPDAYLNDPAREAPHDLYTSTKSLWDAAKKQFLEPPISLFPYGEMTGKSKKAKDVELDFSDYSDVHWKWVGAQKAWARSHDSTKHVLADGGQVMATNVVIQIVEVHDGKHLDPAGNPVPEVTLIGSGKAYLLRDGQMYSGKWHRGSKKGVTTFATAGGQEFVLAPGKTWVELFPKDRGKPQL